MTDSPAATVGSGPSSTRLARCAHRPVRSSLAGARSMLPASRRHSLALAAILTSGSRS